ncbi:MAG TPA: 30S ribosomal protein S20 [Polyangiaceae bacterium]|jgi:small subunit ribosomal protein S20|nr:30S ribosomal protein S20 [Polyangiaceae bacterium]
MANHPSAEKRNRQRIRRTERNRSVKGAVRTLLKKARAAIAAPGTEATASASAIAAAVKAVDRAASKGVVHPKMAARAKSRLAKAAHKTKSATA